MIEKDYWWEAHCKINQGITDFDIELVQGLMDKIVELGERKKTLESLNKYPIQSSVVKLLNSLSDPNAADKLIIELLQGERLHKDILFKVSIDSKDFLFLQIECHWSWAGYSEDIVKRVKQYC